MFEPIENRLLPSFLIIGGIKCGTSSIYRYLCSHPNILPCVEKEPGFFSSPSLAKLKSGFEDYCKLFPKGEASGELTANWVDLEEDESFSQSKFSNQKIAGTAYQTCEATANTYFRGRPGAVKTVLPNAKLIMLVRNPTDRFISHYRMYQRFDQAGRGGYKVSNIEQFTEREIELYETNQPTRIIHQGHYIKYLRRWRDVFGKENLLVLKTDTLQTVQSGQQCLRSVTDFLNLQAHDFSQVLDTKYNQAKPYQGRQDIIEKLNQFYAISNAQLKEEFDIDFLSSNNDF